MVTHDPQKTLQDEERENITYQFFSKDKKGVNYWNMCKRLAQQWIYPKSPDYTAQPEN